MRNKFNQYFGIILDALFFEGTTTKRGYNSLKTAVLSFVVSTMAVLTLTVFTNSIIWSKLWGFLGVNMFFGIIFYVGYKTNGFEKEPKDLIRSLLSKGSKRLKA